MVAESGGDVGLAHARHPQRLELVVAAHGGERDADAKAELATAMEGPPSIAAQALLLLAKRSMRATTPPLTWVAAAPRPRLPTRC